MDKVRLYLIRHGEVQGAKQSRIHGHIDVKLSNNGMQQMKNVASTLESVPLSAIFSSDLKRAVYGARCISASRNISPILFPSFREIYFGDWQGKTHADLLEMYKGKTIDQIMVGIDQDHVHGGESIQDVWHRTIQQLEALLPNYYGKSIAIVAHSGVNRCIISHAVSGSFHFFWKFDQQYGCINIIDFFNDKTSRVVLLNSTHI